MSTNTNTNEAPDIALDIAAAVLSKMAQLNPVAATSFVGAEYSLADTIREALKEYQAQFRAEAKPGDVEWLQLAAKAAQEKIPDSHGFILLAMPYGVDGFMRYSATVQREDAIKVLRKFFFHIGAAEDWMKHIA